MKKKFVITDTGWHKLFDGHARQMFGFPVGRLCEKFSDETKFETRTSRGHRLFPHIWRGLYRSKGTTNNDIIFCKKIIVIHFCTSYSRLSRC